jgi:hypothetical protein
VKPYDRIGIEADHMIDCDMIRLLLMIRLIYLLRIDGATEFTPVIPELQPEDESNGGG